MSISENFHIIDYEIDNLIDCLTHKTYSPKEQIKNSNHVKFFEEYLGPSGLNATNIVFEKHYVSKDYLSDYVLYYSKCFNNYEKHCKRIHLFKSKEPNTFEKDFLSTINNNPEKKTEIANSYLGCIVVKPIPLTIIGNTILKAYPEKAIDGKRYYWGVKPYQINLFGYEFEIESLAFQEQDTVVSACATTAIWVMLQKASSMYYSDLKNPNEITQDANAIESKIGERIFPTNGLNIQQMSRAIKETGLDPEVREGKTEVHLDIPIPRSIKAIKTQYLKSLVNAYYPLGVPIIMVLSVPENDKYYLHAVTVAGHKYKDNESGAPSPEVSRISELIDEVYVHDDKWGPFARLKIIDNIKFESNWTIFDSPTKRPTYLEYVIIPVYPKVRISYDHIDRIITGIDFTFYYAFKDYFNYDLQWNIRIHTSNDYKKHIRKSNLTEAKKQKYLTSSLPRFVWVATVAVDFAPLFDIVFDATDVSTNMFGIYLVSYYSKHQNHLLKYLELNDWLRDRQELNILRYLDFMLKQLSG